MCEHGLRIELSEAMDYNRTRDLVEGDHHHYSHINKIVNYLFIYPCLYLFFNSLFICGRNKDLRIRKRPPV